MIRAWQKVLTENLRGQGDLMMQCRTLLMQTSIELNSTLRPRGYGNSKQFGRLISP